MACSCIVRVEETELATKSEQAMKQLQQEILQLQIEFRTQTKRARESQQPKVRLLIIVDQLSQI